MKHRNFLARFRTFAGYAARNEDGSSAVFGAITSFTLVLFIMMTYNTGMLSADRIMMQNAADATAYSGAVVEANSLNAIAQINDGMAYIYYTVMRYSIDAIVYGTLNLFKQHPDYGPVKVLGATALPGPRKLGNNNPPAPDNIVGGYSSAGGPGESYDQAATRANKMIPLGLKWLHHFAAAERLIARATPYAMKRVMYRVAKANGAERIAIFPPLKPEFMFKEGSKDGLLEDSKVGAAGSGGGGGDKLVPESFAERYQDKRLFVDSLAVRVPKWYFALNGRSGRLANGEELYYQVRLCWNREDLGHGEGAPTSDRPSHRNSPQPYQKEKPAPNGHWHTVHVHQVLVPDPTGQFQPNPFPVTHYAGHGNDNSDPDLRRPLYPVPFPFRWSHTRDESPESHNPYEHHSAQICPTCRNLDQSSGAGNPGGVGFTSIRVQEDGPSDANNLVLSENKVKAWMRDLKVAYQQKVPGPRPPGHIFPRPLALNRHVFHNGVNVAVHRQFRETIVGNIFKVPSWGQVAMASASVGVLKDDGVVDTTDSRIGESTRGDWPIKGSTNDFPDDDANLYLTKELQFGARLVPTIQSRYGPSSDPAKGFPAPAGLDRLMTGTRWRSLSGSKPWENDSVDTTGQDAGRHLAVQINFRNATIENVIHH